MSLFMLTLLSILLCVGGSLIGTWISLKLAVRFKVWDDPKSNPNRKKQKQPVPLLGATGFTFVCSLAMSLLWLANKYDTFGIRDVLQSNLQQPFKLIWVLVALLILVVAGYVDDKYDLSAKWGSLAILAALVITVFLGGLKIEALSYPFDSFLPHSSFLPYILSFLWLGFCLMSTKVLDGHDGLVSSVGLIGFLTIASVSMFSNVNQPLIFVFGIVWACGMIGFLPFNFPNATLYLGNAGSQIIGLMIGILSILSGAKIATASTVIGWFILDILFVWLLRILDKRNPLTSGDRLHWHFRLVDLGLQKVQVLALTVLILLVASHVGLLFGTQYKVYVLFGQLVILLGAFAVTYWLSKKKRQSVALVKVD